MFVYFGAVHRLAVTCDCVRILFPMPDERPTSSIYNAPDAALCLLAVYDKFFYYFTLVIEL